MNPKKTYLIFLLCLAAQVSFAQNTNYGTNAGNAGSLNTSIGYEAGNIITACCGTFVGHAAGKSVTSGNSNSFIGAYSGSLTSSAADNSFLGYASGYSNTNGSGNSFVGAWSGLFSTGSNNSFLGAYSGYNNTSGSYNAFVGYQSGYRNTSGIRNSFFGQSSGYTNSTGSDNVFIGSQSGYGNTTGFYNSFFGSGSGYINSTGSRNSFFGYQAGYNNTDGENNSFFGNTAGQANTTGKYNTFLGSSSGYRNTTGQDNVFVGFGSGVYSVTAWGNTFVGALSGQLTTAGYNTFVGYGAGGNVTTGGSNLYVGSQTGRYNSAGSGNTYLGDLAGFSSTGSNNIFIGYRTGPYESASNKLIVGYDNIFLYGDIAEKKLGIGTTSLGSYVLSVNGDAFATGLWVSSDRRFKRNEQSIVNSLERVRSVHGMSYEFKTGNAAEGRNFGAGKQLGFIAQDLQKVFPELVKEDGSGYLAVNYQGMIPVLVEAIKELSEEVTYLKTKIGTHGLEKITDQNSPASGAALRQNYPNPADQITTIEYSLPDEAMQGILYVFDLNGKQVAVYDQLNKGNGSVTISAAKLRPGLYHYCLVVDGNIVDTKKMLLTSK